MARMPRMYSSSISILHPHFLHSNFVSHYHTIHHPFSSRLLDRAGTGPVQLTNSRNLLRQMRDDSLRLIIKSIGGRNRLKNRANPALVSAFYALRYGRMTLLGSSMVFRVAK